MDWEVWVRRTGDRGHGIRGTHDGMPILMTGEVVDQAKVFPHTEEPVQRR